MHRRSAIAGVLSLPLLARAVAPPELGALRPQGRGQLRWFGLLIYDIRLWARETVDAQNWASQSLALELEYARSLSGREIAKRSLVLPWLPWGPPIGGGRAGDPPGAL